MPPIQAAALVGAEVKPRSGRRSFVNCPFPVRSSLSKAGSSAIGPDAWRARNNEQARVRLRDEARGVDHQAAERIPATGERSANSRKIPADMRGEHAANVPKNDHSRRPIIDAQWFHQFQKGHNVPERSPFEPDVDARAGKGPGKGTTPRRDRRARQIGGRHLGNVTSSKCSLLQFGSSRPSSSGRNRLANRHQQEGPSPARVMPPRAKNSRNSNVAAPDEPRRRAGRGRASRRRTTDCASRAGSSYRSDPSGAQGDGGSMYKIRSRFLGRFAVVSVSARPIDFRAVSDAAESKRRASGS